MDNPKQITGEWIREQCKFVYRKYNSNSNTFVFNPSAAKELNDEIKQYQAICPHEYDTNGYCIYCKKIEEMMLNEAT